MTVEERLERIEAVLAALLDRRVSTKAFYAIDEFARLVGRAEFTVREWCRQGRLLASKKESGRGAHAAWAISREELLRYQRAGLRPARRKAIARLSK